VLDACVVSINSDEVDNFLEQLDTAYHSVQEGNM
jgi:cell division septum initiation protein DivIVA